MKRPAEAEAAYRARAGRRASGQQSGLRAGQPADQARRGPGAGRKAVAKDEKRASYPDTLGVVLMARNELPAARRAFERGTALEPANVALRQLAQSLAPWPETLGLTRPGSADSGCPACWSP